MNDHDTDVLIIGAGLTGAMIAAKLAEQGMRVAVMDALTVGRVAVRRAVGLATPDPSTPHFAETARGVELLGHVAARRGLMAQPCEVLHLARNNAGEELLRQALQALKVVTPNVDWAGTDRPGVLPPGHRGGLIMRKSLLVDVELLVLKLLQSAGITVCQNVEVEKLEWHRGNTYVLGTGRTVRADCVVLATNAYTGLLSPYLAESVRIARGAIWTSRPFQDGLQDRQAAKPPLTMPMIVDNGRLIFAPTRDARLKAGAWQWDANGSSAATAASTAGAAGSEPADELHKFLRNIAPNLHLLDQTEQWISGVTTVTDDGAPLIGRLDSDGNVLYAIGLGTYGLAWSPIVAERIAELAK